MSTRTYFTAYPGWILAGLLLISLLAACGRAAGEDSSVALSADQPAPGPAPTSTPAPSPTAIPTRTALPTRGVWPDYPTWTPSPPPPTWTPSPTPVRLSRSCLADLPPMIPSLDELDQPADLIVERWQPGMWVGPDLSVLQVTSAGVARQISFDFQRDQPLTPTTGHWLILQPGSYDIRTCETWTIPLSLTESLQTVLDEPAFIALTTEAINPMPEGCPDDPGLALVTPQRSRRQPLNVWCTAYAGGSQELMAVEAFFWEIRGYEYAGPRQQ